MALWVIGDIQSDSQMMYDQPDKTLVIYGKLASKSEISIKVHNLVVVGDISSDKKISILAEKNVFFIGEALAKERSIVAYEGIHWGATQKALQGIKALGIVYSRTEAGIRLHPPASLDSL